jgi:hypothetical protein
MRDLKRRSGNKARVTPGRIVAKVFVFALIIEDETSVVEAVFFEDGIQIEIGFSLRQYWTEVIFFTLF